MEGPSQTALSSAGRAPLPLRARVRRAFRAQPTLPYLTAVLAVGLAAVLRLGLESVLTQDRPYLLMFAAVTASAWLGGLGPGLLATGLSVFAVELVRASSGGPDAHSLLFAGEAAIITLLAHRLRRARLQSDTAHEQFRLLVDGTRDYAIVMLDPEGRVESWNEGARRISGYDARAIRGSHYERFFEPAERAAGRPRALLEEAARTGRVEYEGWRVRQDGSRYWGDVILTALRDDRGSLRGYSLITRDLTERKRLEDELRQRLEELGVAAKQKDRYIAALAHELRNPLAPIQSTVELLQLQDDDPARRAHYELIERQTVHLRHLLDDLLDLSRFARGTVELAMEDVALAGVVEDAIADTRSSIYGRRHTLDVALDRSVYVRGDRVRLVQIFTNLLANAAKYTDPGGRIAVTLEREGAEAVVRVRDTGIGMSADMLAQAFEPFTQADRSLARTQGGLGLGLAIVRRLAELHGGRVAAHSDGIGRGSELTVWLPARAVASPAPREPEPAAPAAAGPLRVLVVDDSVENAETMAALLRLKHHTTETAHDGPSALAACGRFRPDVVLLDIGLPGMTGYDVAREIRATPELRHVALIAMTGYGQVADREASRAAGIDCHLVKPVKLATLVEALASVRAG